MALLNPSETIPTKSSKGEEWKAWYLELKSRYGKKTANNIFTKAWRLRGSDSALTNDLDTVLKKDGINLQRGAIASIQEGAYGALDSIESVLGMPKKILIVGGILVGVPLFIFLIQLARKPERVGSIAGSAGKAMI